MHRGGPSITAAQEEAAIQAAAMAEARRSLVATTDACRTEPHAEYGGEFVVKWGEAHLTVSGRGQAPSG
jgi:hypothetical protein